ncbi:site-specific DNA-methyltransferase [Burkholderia cenocepacia]|uniref:site-specific DNA-methyltransferase n=1 Tax=Burkholderia cenocepacia TaxID=95486 RepID=UPI0026562748|nr:site-specific DNA-methyltransferase [Burkholderia cenocepacia]MDN7642357.1 site-specific DNA-methyltransferase [Burkholderia cenocepacia]
MPFLDWINKNQAKASLRDVPYHLLKQEAVYGDGQENLLIEGDNLLALKALIPFYAGQVKCIFIDPPYNTQSAFEHYDDKLEHSQWLSMMYPRLVLLRDLLAEDGSIWVTIDDNEAHYLKVLMDEVFGRKNAVGDITWHKRVSPANDAKFFSSDTDHILVYARSIDVWRPNRLHRSEEQLAYYKNPDNDHRGVWNSSAYTCAKSAEERPNLYYPITNPYTGNDVWPSKTRVWAYDPVTHAKNVAENRLYWGVDGTAKMPRIKKFLSETKPVVPRSLWAHSDTGHNQESKMEAEALFPGAPFGTPKPERLLQRVIHIATNTGDLVLDSFLGSGTTAAVAHKTNRRYIGIEMGQHARTHCIPRLQKVIEGEQGGISESVNWKGGGGFRFCTLGEPAFDAGGRINTSVNFATLAAFIWHTETGRPGHQTFDSPLLGVANGTAYYLLYNGILEDHRPAGGNVLTPAVLDAIKSLFPHDGPKIVYGEMTRIGGARLAAENLVFKQIPYDVTIR